ncbi:TonB-dependent receptor [Flavobacteriales bacterium]|nr:TonB-dependent receptor [Flavobacteriales bacterium]
MKKIFTILILSFIVTSSYAQKKYTISGYITDKNNGESIVGANVYCTALNLGVTSNTYGFYSLTLPEGVYDISFTFISYQNQVKNFNFNSAVNHDIEFELSSVNIREIVVTGEKNIVETTQTSMIEVPIEQIRTIPALLGEVDILKAIQLLPGVQSSEGSSGFYVRGGGPDQNLILLDGVPVYNASHIGGLFSVFNADAIKNLRLTKGGFPARFGGRLSSVLEIDMREGNIKEFKGDATLGLISSKLTIEGPIIKNRTSFIVSGRRTYADLLAGPFMPASTDLTLYFYDLNAKINHKISKRDRIYLSAYMGNDAFGVDFDGSQEGGKGEESSDNGVLNFGLGYGNLTSTLRWNHLFSDKLFSNTTLTYSRYSFNTNFGLTSYNTNENTAINFDYLAGIEDFGGRIDFDYMPNPNHDIKFGTSYTYHHFFPGEVNQNINIQSSDTSRNFSLDTTLNFSGNTNVHEMFLYMEDNVKITSRLKANIGFHIGFYSLANNSTTDNIGLADKIIDKNNISLQPRVSARYLMNESWSLKASYASMEQNIHLLSNSSVGFPSDIWVPAIESVPSQKSKQWAGSVSTLLLQGAYELSLEGYYKTMSNLITYKAGYSNLESTESWQNAVETGGEGKTYGMELFLQKKKGKTTGWIGYTLSWADRRFDNINFGEWYSYKYDRRHDFSLVISHKFNDKWYVGATWVYGTGNAITFPQGVYTGMPKISPWDEQVAVDFVESYGNRNSTRLPAYHRLDFGVNKHKKRKKWDSTLSLGAYNVYNRKNPFFAYLAYDDNQRVAKQVSLFPIIPSISYRIQF